MSGGCSCRRPHPSPNPRLPDTCSACGRPIAGPGISTDETSKEFFDRLEAGMFSPKAPAGERRFFRSVRALAEHREREGREKFGFDYLEHDFCKNVSEEAADVLVYTALRNLRTLRETGEEDGIEMLLQGCSEVIGGLETLLRYPAKRRGSP